ncbi:hypothetical protein, partial [Dysosmobacter sp. HCP28S3_G4]|uniref:hypothetical protein n=1 Tax=Dysosmobacter sp. HCP28S3_G4 TaxID=3438938 RepID=UPI003F8A5042
QGGNGMTLPISYFRFYFPEYVLKTRLPPNCATGFLDRLKWPRDIPHGHLSASESFFEKMKKVVDKCRTVWYPKQAVSNSTVKTGKSFKTDGRVTKEKS